MPELVDAMQGSRAIKAMQDTWGHLLPTIKNQSFQGTMIYVFGNYDGLIGLLDSKFEGLSNSPWIYEAMSDYMYDRCSEKGTGIFKWTGKCTFRIKKDRERMWNPDAVIPYFTFCGKIEKQEFKDM